MGIEQPLLGAAVARLPDPSVHLAAFGSLVFPVALVIEAPVIMLLAASTELSRDRAAYRSLARVTHGLGFVLTVAHLALAATPAFDWMAATVFDVPPQVRGPARLGMLMLAPWTWAIASRRFHQGALIRHGQSKVVGWGTGLRLVVTSSVLGLGLWHGEGPGAVVAACALSSGVIAEAIYAAIRVRSVVRQLPAISERPPLSGREFISFYVPLAMTPLVTLFVLPFGTAAVSRMPQALPSLAVWPMINGLVFVLQALGLAYNEVVVAMLARPGARRALWRFCVGLTVATTGVLAVISLSPLAYGWFHDVSGLSPDLAERGVDVLWMALPIPAMRVLQSWYQGGLVFARKTRVITEAVVVFALTCCGVLLFGVYQAAWPGLTVMIVSYSLGRIVQTVWLAMRGRGLY